MKFGEISTNGYWDTANENLWDTHFRGVSPAKLYASNLNK